MILNITNTNTEYFGCSCISDTWNTKYRHMYCIDLLQKLNCFESKIFKNLSISHIYKSTPQVGNHTKC